jgi:hypothetical protein
MRRMQPITDMCIGWYMYGTQAPFASSNYVKY